MTRLVVAGAGRMGQSIVRRVATDDAGFDDFTVAGVWSRDPAAHADRFSGINVSDDLPGLLANADVLIDFSLPDATAEVVAAVISTATPLVCGVSGLDDEQLQGIEVAARQIPLVYDRNMSRGIAALDECVRRAASRLGPDVAIEIHETHHVHKKDAPSGTALKLGESIAAAMGPENTPEIHYESERRGEVPGDHSVIFRSATETLTFGHSVTTRDVFADGALVAARWLPGRAPGRYSMRDVLFAE